MRTFERIFVHTTAASYKTIPRQFLAVNTWHKDRFKTYYNEKEKEQVNPSSLGYYGGYHILIEPDGTEFRYREDWEETIAVIGHNRSSLSVALAFDGDKELPTPAQVKALTARLKTWVEKYKIPVDPDHISPHRRGQPGKSCYGNLLTDEWACSLLKEIPKELEEAKKEVGTVKAYKPAQHELESKLLQLKILLGKYIEVLNKRIKK